MILYLIPARGGSKRLSGKNIRKFDGVPLVARAVLLARAAARIVSATHTVVVSTDSEEIASVTRAWAAKVLMRPAELATDSATSESVALHALQEYANADTLVLIQPTSPLTIPEDIARAVWAFRDYGPAATCREGEHVPNGAAYVVGPGRANYLPKRLRHLVPSPYGTIYTAGDVPVYMPASRSIDIDTEEDWQEAERLWMARGRYKLVDA